MDSLIIHVGAHILQNPAVQASIKSVVVAGLKAVVAFITPYIIPALIVLGIIVMAISIVWLIREVAKWIMLQYA